MKNSRFGPRFFLAAALSISTVSAASGEAAGRLPFVENDYARALRDARTRHVPIFVEAWAPW